ncbi:MAG: hypothetical protein J6U54_15410 [Clostridiales bacterium]|nr:hypothetical protein [Clostridiales bacterium]
MTKSINNNIMPNFKSIPSLVEGGVRSIHYKRVIAKEAIASRKCMLEKLEKKLNLPFKLKNMIDNIPVANLQIGDTVRFLNEGPVSYEYTKQIYCFAMVNSYKCLVSWFDFKWYLGSNLNNAEIPTCEALEKLFPRHGESVNFDFMFNNTFVVSAYCDVERYQFNYDGTPCYVHEIIDGEEVPVRARTRFQMPMYKIL